MNNFPFGLRPSAARQRSASPGEPVEPASSPALQEAVAAVEAAPEAAPVVAAAAEATPAPVAPVSRSPQPDRAKQFRDHHAARDLFASADGAVVRSMERERIRQILLSPVGVRNAAAALEMAIETDMSATQAIGILALSRPGAEAPRGAALRSRMAATSVPAVGGETPAPAMSTAQYIIQMGKTRRGEKV